MIYLGYLLIFGFILTVLIGGLASWLDRKLTARLQYRVGPPLWQPFIDICKLLSKETVIPSGVSKGLFLAAPILGLVSVIVVSTMLWINALIGGVTFLGDIIVVLYFLVMPSVALMLGGIASRNPLASLGASREMKLILSYELPFILVVLVPVIKCGYSIRLGEIIDFQTLHGYCAASWSGFLAFIVAILCAQAKLGLGPFDVSEAETEIAGGVLIEYSGAPLAVFRIMKNMLLCSVPLFLMVMFWGGLRTAGRGMLESLLVFTGIIVFFTLIRNTNPRVRIDQAVRFFWGPVMLMAVLSVVLAWKGL